MAKSQGMTFTPRLRLRPGVTTRRSDAAEPASAAVSPPTKSRAAPQPFDRRLRGLTLSPVLNGAHTELLRLAVRRSRAALLCPCGGQALKVRTTPAERARFGGEGFARAFVCTDCRTRYIGRARAQSLWPL